MNGALHDVLVVGGGIAGTMAVLTAVSRGLDVAWIADRIGPADQSAHWHGHLHRGRLYDPVREHDLIEELGRNAAFWWSDAVTPFHTDIPTIAVGPDRRWASSFRRRLGSATHRMTPPPFLRDDVAAVRTDEAILDGPAFLGAASDLASSHSHRIDGRCIDLRQLRVDVWESEFADVTGGTHVVHARSVVLATGTAAPELVPGTLRLDRVLDARLSRMLVLRGALPRVAAIVPSRAAGGLFFASREIPGAAENERVWLVSDGFSSGGTQRRGSLTDAWWACSVVERMTGFVQEDLLQQVSVGAYRAPKSRVASSPTQVPADGFAVDRARSFVALTPSKWSATPTSAVHALAALVPDRLRPEDRMAAVADLLRDARRPRVPAFEETWRTVGVWSRLADLRGPSIEALHRASEIFQPEAAAPPAVLQGVVA